MICAPDGGILDDLVVYRQADDRFLVIANASNSAVVTGRGAQRTGRRRCDQVARRRPMTPRSSPFRDRTRPRPNRQPKLAWALALKYYSGGYAEVAASPGLGGADRLHRRGRLRGVLPSAGRRARVGRAHGSWRPAWSRRAWRPVTRSGLEAGMPLYGNELGRDVTPYEAGLARVVGWTSRGTSSAGRRWRRPRKQTGPVVLIGLIARSRRVPRHGYPVLSAARKSGTVTSGAPSPTLGVPVAMAYVTREVAEPGAGTEFGIDVRGRVSPPTALSCLSTGGVSKHERSRRAPLYRGA